MGNGYLKEEKKGVKKYPGQRPGFIILLGNYPAPLQIDEKERKIFICFEYSTKQDLEMYQRKSPRMECGGNTL